MAKLTFKHNEWSETGLRRVADGLLLVKSVTGYIIQPPDGTAPLRTCPCCNKFLATPAAAQSVADAMFPLNDQG